MPHKNVPRFRISEREHELMAEFIGSWIDRIQLMSPWLDETEDDAARIAALRLRRARNWLEKAREQLAVIASRDGVPHRYAVAPGSEERETI